MGNLLPFDRQVALRHKMSRMADEIFALAERCQEVPEPQRPALMVKIDALARELNSLIDSSKIKNPPSRGRVPGSGFSVPSSHPNPKLETRNPELSDRKHETLLPGGSND